ncbi:MAG: primosomal protein N' [Erysipelotrichaceae bacterium]|nr:primosomal protein N' [Erysipelotrichaceae bacterium]
MYLLEVYVTNAALNVNRPFTYLSEKKVDLYCRVKVRFHNGDNLAIVCKCEETDLSLDQLREELGYEPLFIISKVDEQPVLSAELFELAGWLAKTTVSPFISCLNSMLPKALKTSKKHTDPKMVSRFRKNERDFSFTVKQKEVYDKLYDGILCADARKISVSIINKLIAMNAIEAYEEEAVYHNTPVHSSAFKKLTPSQQDAYEKILSLQKNVSLLFGVTGSGKTEVYLHLARHYLSLGKDVLILVPEISLTPQMIQRVKERFSDAVFYHSELSDQERYEQYKRVRDKEVRIVVGTRSSVFLPFHDLGLIIIDEEHDSSYKQDSTPCYHVKNVAFKRAIDHHGKVLLASATPSLESYTRALRGDYQLLELKDRINHSFPKIGIIDLNKEVRNHSSYIITRPLKEAIRDCLDQGKQAIILLNRRGYSPIVKCGECGSTLMCQDCDTPLNYHKDENVLKCHQCGRVYKLIDRCPSCGHKPLLYYGFGTKKAEEELQKSFPEARIARMDRDSTYKKGAHEAILRRFEQHEADILLGTQMIAKGLDYPDVTLVGILNADAGLMHQDYNSAKVTFDLLMQASGRSGRADHEGKVLIQAFNPDHYAIKAVLAQDYVYFYNIEMNYRNKTKYPPYSHIIEILLSDNDQAKILDSVNYLYGQIKDLPFKIYKPYELGRLKGLYRYRLLMMDKDLLQLLRTSNEIIRDYVAMKKHARVKIDVDPLYLE